jgi:hypothetical protein
LTTAANGNVNTVAARAAFAAKFYVGIPESLPAAERDRRAAAARRLHMARLAYHSVRARGKRKAAPERDSGAALVGEGTPHAQRSTV